MRILKRHVKIGVGISVIVLVMVLGITPYYVGKLFQEKYTKLLSYYNLHGDVRLQLTSFHRGWLSSDATVVIDISNTEWHSLLETVGISTKGLQGAQFTLHQHIQHGPLFYYFSVSLPSHFGLAVIHNKLELSQELAMFLSGLGLSDRSIEMNEDFISFRGNYFKFLRLNQVNFFYPLSELQVQLKLLEGGFWYSPLERRVNGHARLDQLTIISKTDKAIVPKADFDFSQWQDDFGLWVGDHDVRVSAIQFQQSSGRRITATDISFSGTAEEENGLLHGTRQLAVASIKLDDQLFGPLHFRVSAENLNAKTIAEMISAYKDILQEGEAYQSQLQEKMAIMLPKVIQPGTRITLNDFYLVTPFGQLQMSGSILWPQENFVKLSDVSEMVQAAKTRLSASMTKLMMDQVIQVASGLPRLMRDMPAEDKEALQDLREQLDFSVRTNTMLLGEYARNRQVPQAAEAKLLVMQKELVTYDDYVAEIKRLYLAKQMTRETADFLAIQYAAVQQPYLELLLHVNQYREDIQKMLHTELDELIKDGYVTVEDKNYTLMLNWSSGKLKMNGKEVK